MYYCKAIELYISAYVKHIFSRPRHEGSVRIISFDNLLLCCLVWKIEITAVGYPRLWLRDTSLSAKVATNFADKRRSLGLYSLLADPGHGVCFLLSCCSGLGKHIEISGSWRNRLYALLSAHAFKLGYRVWYLSGRASDFSESTRFEFPSEHWLIPCS
jgi:hypothetical protein